MSNMNEIKVALEILTRNGSKKAQITVLHCNTEYPTPYRDINLKAMNSIGNIYGVNIGYSDHSLGIEVPIAAVALGAKVIEKHFTLDKNLDGPDHMCSLSPDELKRMVSSIRNIEEALSGNGEKTPSESEKKNIEIARKSVHINTSILRGETIKKEHIICLRPGDGISPMNINKVIGLKAKKDLKPFTKLSKSHLI